MSLAFRSIQRGLLPLAERKVRPARRPTGEEVYSPGHMASSKKSPAPKKVAAKKQVAKKAKLKKPTSKKVVAKSTTKKAPANKAAAKTSPSKRAPTRLVPAKTSPAKAVTRKAKPKAKARASRPTPAKPAFFASLTEGERADSLRLLLEDPRLANMAKVGRYRVIAIEPLALKGTGPLASSRLARVVIYDYSADRCVAANVDLDHYLVHHLSINRSQPMLAIEEEVHAMEIAVADERVRSKLTLSEGPQSAMHYWSQRTAELSYSRRSAAVLLGEPGARPSLVAVVDLLDACVTEVVPAEQW